MKTEASGDDAVDPGNQRSSGDAKRQVFTPPDLDAEEGCAFLHHTHISLSLAQA
jgi:hypothetical protein